jgi:hypothetical protein
MTVQIYDCEQGSPEWFAARLGIPTASEFKTIIGIKKDAREKVTRRTYMHKLAGEILTGLPMESYSNENMERGKAMEEEARDAYAFMRNADPQLVGFIRSGNTGCSPDSLIGDNGILEIKTKLPHLLIDCLLKDEFPPEHKAQCQGALWIAEREFIDIAIYWPKLPLFVKRSYREDGYIANLAGAVREFNEELAEIVYRIRRYGSPSAVLKYQLEESVRLTGTDPQTIAAG